MFQRTAADGRTPNVEEQRPPVMIVPDREHAKREVGDSSEKEHWPSVWV
jgi:hypothetical protein